MICYKKGLLIIIAGTVFMFVSCVSITFTKYNSWNEPELLNKSGKIAIPEGAWIDFEYGFYDLPIIRGVISTDLFSEEILIAFDTGMNGSYIDEKVVRKMNDAIGSDARFRSQLIDRSITKGESYSFVSLQMGQACISQPLLCSMDMSKIGIQSKNGQKIQCIIGMNVLGKSPFLFSNSEQKIFFPDTTELELLTDFVQIPAITTKNDLRLRFEIPAYKDHFSFIPDTGSDISYLSKPFVKKEITKANSTYRYHRMFQGKRAEGIFTEFLFFDEDGLTTPFQENIHKANTVGYSILKKYDFCIDYANQCFYMKPLSQSPGLYPENIRILIQTFLNPTFGFSLQEAGVKRFVEGIYSDANNKIYVPQLKLGDELISVNGITLDKIDWTIWYQLDEADFVFRRKGKEFALHLKRQGIEGL